MRIARGAALLVMVCVVMGRVVMGRVVMGRVVMGSVVMGSVVMVCVVIVSIIMAGCSANRPTRDPQTTGLATAMLSARDMPPGFLPAQNQQVFGGLSPHDPDCRRLLALADLDDLRGGSAQSSPVPPQAHAVFYRTEPGSTLAEHLLTLSPAQALGRIGDIRRAAAGCPSIDLGPGPGHPHRHRHAHPPGYRHAPGHRVWRGAPTDDRPGHDGHGGHGHGRHGHGGHGQDRYGRGGHGQDWYGQDWYGRGGHELGRHRRHVPRRHGHERDEYGSGRGDAERGASGFGDTERGRSNPSNPSDPGDPGEHETGHAEYGTAPGESERKSHGHGHGRFGLAPGLMPGSGLMPGRWFGSWLVPGLLPGLLPGLGQSDDGGRAHRPGLLHRVPMALPGLRGNIYGLRYSGRLSRRYRVHVDLVMAALGGRLLIMEQPTLIDRESSEGDSFLRIVKAALRKLRKTTPILGAEPIPHPTPTRS